MCDRKQQPVSVNNITLGIINQTGYFSHELAASVPEARIKWNKPGSSCSSSNLRTSFLSSLVVTSLLSSHPDPAGILLGDASPGLLLGDALSGSVQVCTLVVFVNLADLFYTTTTLRNVFGIPTSVATFTEFLNSELILISSRHHSTVRQLRS